MRPTAKEVREHCVHESGADSFKMVVVPKDVESPIPLTDDRARKAYAAYLRRGNNTIYVQNNIQVNLAFIWQIAPKDKKP